VIVLDTNVLSALMRQTRGSGVVDWLDDQPLTFSRPARARGQPVESLRYRARDPSINHVHAARTAQKYADVTSTVAHRFG
jgi:predicted nucleic acid-binding protein